MHAIPTSLWLAVGSISTACISAFTISIQRAYQHKSRRETEAGPDPSPLHFDSKRDPSVPFADVGRIPRLSFNTTILVLIAIYNLYACVQSFSGNQSQEALHTVLSAAFTLATWVYALALALTACRHRLPSDWGFVINVHLCFVYLAAWCYSVWTLYDTWRSGPSWSSGMPKMVSFLLTTDLLCVTATAKRGAPFIDEHGRTVTSRTVSSVFGFFFFTWMQSLVRFACKKRKLDDDDLPILPAIYRGYNLFYIFGESRGNRLLYRIWDANRLAIVLQIILSVVSALMYYLPPFFTNRLLQVIQDMSEGKRLETGLQEGFMIVFQQTVSLVLLGLVIAQLWYYAASSLQVRLKAMLNIEIYHKTLRRLDSAVTGGAHESTEDAKSKSKDESESSEEDEDVTSTGQIVNLMSTDSDRISEFSTWWFHAISLPVELFVGIYFLYAILGVACFVGLSIIVLTLPINHFNAKIFAKTQDRLMDARDKRVSLMNEVLHGIRQIKFFASEKNWEKRIMQSRQVELNFLRTSYVTEAVFQVVWQGCPILVTALAFWYYTIFEGNELTAPVAFTTLMVFDELRFALVALPDVFIDGLQALTSIRRIEKYLQQDEIEPPAPIRTNDPIRLAFENATVTWTLPSSEEEISSASSEDTYSGDNDAFILKDVDIEFPNEKLSLVCGKTGSGKSLLLLSLLGEAVVSKGKVYCPRAPISETITADFAVLDNIPEEEWILEHSMAYAAQTAWLQNASIRDNILFGLPYVEKRYQATLAACALDKDLSIFEDGDMTEIGEKGITLSGGQKARVALARAVYSRAKNVLMDDVLSAVDAHTAKHLYRNCLMGPLMKGRTRILVTHHIKLCLGGSDYLVHVDDGRTDVAGTPAELRQSGALAAVLDEDEEDEEDIIEDEAEQVIEEAATQDADADVPKKAPKALIEEEHRETGKVKLRLYNTYLQAAGGWWFLLIVLVFCISNRMAEVGETWWIKHWTRTDDEPIDTFSTTAATVMPDTGERTLPRYTAMLYQPGDGVQTSSVHGSDNVMYYLGVYVLITASGVLFTLLRFIGVFIGGLRASRKMYRELLHRVFRAPLRFFDTTPIGRILNRFSRDFETIDSQIPLVTINFAQSTICIISIVVAVSASLPMFTGPMILIIALNVAAGYMFVVTSRELKRMDSVTRSPLFSHFSETIVGVSTIRAFGVTRQFLQEMLKRVDTNARPYYYVWTANRWVSLQMSLLGMVVTGATGITILLNLHRVDSATAGFILTFVLSLNDNMFWGIRRYTSMEMSFNAVERVVEFMEMDQEAPTVTDVRPPPMWPSEGRIEVHDLEVRYAPELDPVLRGLSFAVNPREKVGVVGRTGSGKSTLALSFFRFVEATRGSIVIDGIDIKDIGTEDLRGNLTIIPQDPTLFSGTLRSNMDPFDQFSDDDIFIALRRVHLLPSGDSLDTDELDAVNANVFRDLKTTVSEGGKNFSQGQRQLLCLARALLRRCRLVLMDEATASVDFKTDKAIQKTITTEFADCSILCIAHRLHTVIEYDRILVLDQGQIVEYASPMELISNSESVFHQMCRKSGEFDRLLALAKAKHQLVDVDA